MPSGDVEPLEVEEAEEEEREDDEILEVGLENCKAKSKCFSYGLDLYFWFCFSDSFGFGFWVSFGLASFLVFRFLCLVFLCGSQEGVNLATHIH